MIDLANNDDAEMDFAHTDDAAIDFANTDYFDHTDYANIQSDDANFNLI